YIRQMSDEDLNSKFQSQSPQFTKLDQSDQLSITKLIKDRVKKTSDINEFAKFFWEAPVVDKNLFSEKYTEHLEVAQDTILAIEQWNNETINEQLLKSVKDNGFKTGDFFMTLRIAITGQKFTPPINDSIIILGQEETLTRLQKAFSS
ncbi:MAG: Glutamate-tRNA ligase, partial [Candidatus Woesebacteria bacterium GW2011_GWA2_40_7]